MKRLFLAGPFKALVSKETQIMSEDNIKQFSNIIEYFEKINWSIHCAHKRESWGKKFMTPTQCTRIDYDEIDKCDYFIAFPGIPPSPGTHIELGWASAMKKNIILLLEEGEEYAYLVQGLGEISTIRELRYNTEQGVDTKKIEAIINKLELDFNEKTV
jgi:nucleoside 2-deoxyribosyltransferase